LPAHYAAIMKSPHTRDTDQRHTKTSTDHGFLLAASSSKRLLQFPPFDQTKPH